MVSTLMCGTIRLTLLLDATGQVQGDDLFHPAAREEWAEGFAPDEQGNLSVVVSALLISEGDRHTVVDTGYGEDEGGKARPQNLLKSLASVDVQAKQISRVILTHSHGDHVMGNTLYRGGRWLPTFPLAEYVMQHQEAAALRAQDPGLWESRFAPLADRDQFRLLDGYTEIDDSLVCWPTPGHSIGHQSVLIRSTDQQALYLGDLAILARNLERLEWGHSWAWSLAADVESRRQVNEWAIANSGVLILGHDPEMPFVRIARSAGGYRALPYRPS